MKKLYFLMLAVLFGFAGFNANAAVTLKLDDASHYKLMNLQNYEYVALTSGDNVISEAGYYSLDCEEEYYFASLLENGEPAELYSISSFSFNVSSANDGTVYTVSSKAFADARTGSFTVKCDVPEDVKLQFSTTHYEPVLTSTEQSISFIPDVENELTISHVNWNRELYKAFLNGIELPPRYGSYFVDIRDGDVVEVQAKFPEVAVPVHFVYTDGSEGCISRVTVNNEEVSNFNDTDFSVNLGDVLSIYTSDTWENYSLKINGADEYLYSGKDFTIMEETTFIISAVQKPTTNVTFNVDNADAVTLWIGGSYYGYAYSGLVSGNNTIALADYTQVEIKANDGFGLKSVTRTVDGETMKFDSELTSCSVYYLSSFGECLYSVETLSLADARTAKASIFVDDASAVVVMSPAGRVNLQDGDNEYNFIPEVESRLEISATNYGQPLYRVAVNDVDALPNTWGSYELQIEDNDIVVINSKFPEGNAHITFAYADEASKDAISGVQAGNQPVENYQNGFDVALGTKVLVSLNTYDFNIVEFTNNGTPVELGYNGYEFYPSGDTELFISARPYQQLSVTVNVDNAANVVLRRNEGWMPVVIELVDGANELSIPETDNELMLVPSDLGQINSVKANGVDIPFEYGTYTIVAEDGMVIDITTSTIERNLVAAYWTDVFELQWGSVESSYGEYTPYDSYERPFEAGYNLIYFCESDSPFDFRLYWGEEGTATVSPVIYLNNENITDRADYVENGSFYMGDLELSNLDVLKVFTQGAPQVYDVKVTDEENAASFTVDMILDIEDATEGFSALEKTLVYVYPNDGANVKSVTVNGSELELLGSRYEFLVEGESDVVILTETEGLNTISASDLSNGNVYNLQGILVVRNADARQLNSLTPGIYIHNGRKVIIR